MDANQKANIEEYIEGDWDHFYANESDIPFDENELADRLKRNTKPDDNLPTPRVLSDFLADKMKLGDATNETGTPTWSRLILRPWNDDKELGVIRDQQLRRSYFDAIGRGGMEFWFPCLAQSSPS